MSTINSNNNYIDIQFIPVSDGSNLIQGYNITRTGRMFYSSLNNWTDDGGIHYGQIHKYEFKPEFKSYLMYVTIEINKKTIDSKNILYYHLYNLGNSPESYFSANQLNNTDYIEFATILHSNDSSTVVRLYLNAFDINGNPIFGPSVSGLIAIYGLEKEK